MVNWKKITKVPQSDFRDMEQWRSTERYRQIALEERKRYQNDIIVHANHVQGVLLFQ